MIRIKKRLENVLHPKSQSEKTNFWGVHQNSSPFLKVLSLF